MASAVALANLDVFANEEIIENVVEHERAFAEMLDSLRDIPIVGDVRGTGYFRSIELVATRRPRRRSPARRRSGCCAASSPRDVQARADLPRR